GTKTSRLYRRLIEEKQLASNAYAVNTSLGLGGYFQVVATAREGHTVAQLRQEGEAVLDDFRKNGPTAAEVERAKRLVVGGMVRSVERAAGKADQLNNYAFWTGDPGYLARDVARYRAVTVAQVQEAAKNLLLTDRLLVMDVEPSSPAPGARPGAAVVCLPSPGPARGGVCPEQARPASPAGGRPASARRVAQYPASPARCRAVVQGPGPGPAFAPQPAPRPPSREPC